MASLATTVKSAVEALGVYPGGGTAGQIRYLGGLRATAQLLGVTWPSDLAATVAYLGGTAPTAQQLGVGRRQIQLYLAHERQGQPGAPKLHEAITPARAGILATATEARIYADVADPTRARQLSDLVNERVLQTTVREMRAHGVVASFDCWLVVSNDKEIFRKLPAEYITYEPTDDEDRPYLRLFCDAVSLHRWSAAASFLLAGYLTVYGFEATITRIEDMTLTIGPDDLDQSDESEDSAYDDDLDDDDDDDEDDG